MRVRGSTPLAPTIFERIIMNQDRQNLVCSAYSKENVGDMSVEELRIVLITLDGKGRELR